ncbi:IS200/IS605 family transposase [Terrilactibacillus sp. BCM23-1]|uniref:IS200/IS605 family transposase n=1 Tax=Terrilactibacillus tamarindi TaxID=2599694 RepID=A0A6N8CUJ7_9BACI|nr:IS200/IS605 family transposase [Terrilactibacillus tamarindi]
MNCKYHIIFIPKYKRKLIYGKLKKDIGSILRKLFEMKDVEIMEVNAMPDHIHMLVRIPTKMSGLIGKRLLCRYSGIKLKTVAKYIREHGSEDRLRDNLSKREYVDPFKK